MADFIRRQDLHDLVIMGHSMGGGVTLMTYFKVREDDPGRIKKLVLIDSAGYPQKLPWFICHGQGPRTQCRAQQAAVAPVRRRPGAEKMLL